MAIRYIASIGLLALLSGCGGGGGGGSAPTPPPVDTTPNAFTFGNKPDSALSSAITSAPISITGINAATAISITGGEYSIDGGAFTSSAGTINNNQTVTVRVSSSAQFSTPSNAVLTIGGVSATFTATTMAEDKTPDAFGFTAGSNAARNVVLVSNSIAISGINTVTPVSITNGEYSIEGSAYTNAAGTITNNQHVTVRLTTSTQFSTAVTAALTVGTVTGSFIATTQAADTTPDAFSIARKTDVTRDSWVNSDSIGITGINTTTPISIENGEYSIAGGTFTSAAGTLEPDQALVVRVKSSATYSKSARARVTVGGVTGDFEATTELAAIVPNAVEFDGSVVYVLDSTNKLIYRWSNDAGRYLDPFALDATIVAPTDMTYSPSNHRMYLGYGTGALRYIDFTAATPAETPLTTLTAGISTLGDAGNFLVTQINGGYGSGYVLDKNGTSLGNGGYYYGYSHETTWDPVSSRVYYFRDGISPNDLHFDVIDQTTGAVTSTGETPYHGAYSIIGPIRVSVNGQYVLLGSGDLYNRDQLTWAGSLAAQIADARWLANGSLVTLTTASNKTTLRRLGATNLATLEQLNYTGQALRVLGTDQKMAVLALVNNKPRFYTYVPSDDSDNDGVKNTDDAFPLDPAASVDSDRDGYPDAWNAGRSQADSTTGLSLDAFPQDAACWLSSHANSGGTCDYGATMPNYAPDQITQQGDVVYLLSIVNKRVYRWSISTQQYLNPYVVGINQGFTTDVPSHMAVSAAHQRLYLGYETGAIRYIDLASASPVEIPFANTALGVHGLASVGNFVLAQDSSGAWATHYIINAAGTITDQKEWNYYSREYAWDAVSSRVYFFRDDTSPDDLQYEVIDQSTGKITSAGETPYHGSYNIMVPIRVSVNGQYVLLGSGDIYRGSDLTWAGSLAAQLADARWMANGSLVTLTGTSTQTVLRRLGSTNYSALEQLSYTGQALRVVGTDTKMALVLFDNNTVKFKIYVPNDDSDGDGVTNTADAFPLDPAASVDTDLDGYPDSWNTGKSQADSTTGLVIDFFPHDAACWLQSHANSGGTCDYGATMPAYVPDQVEQQGDVVYLLSIVNKRVYRWSISTQKYLDPYVLGSNQGFAALLPTRMALSAAHQRLYLGYESGAIRYIDLASASPAEIPFANTAMGVRGLASVGNYVLAQDSSGAWATHYVISAAGVITDQKEWNYYSHEYAWDPVSSRVFFFRDDTSPNDLQFEVIDQTTGKITSAGETPYHGDYQFGGVIRVTADGQSILVGSGDIYAGTGLTHTSTLGVPVADARWLANGNLVALTTSTGQTQLTRLNGTGFTTLEQKNYTGDALRLVGTDSMMVVLVIDNGTVKFYRYVPNDDGDGDGVANTADAFPLDPAASVDTDHDGYPDSWNAGKSQADSTTGLTLDAFPLDSGCWLAAHGSGGVCNPAAAMTAYVPDQVAQQGNVVYLLSSANKRVYRWSISGAAYLNPWVVGLNQGLATAAPTAMAYSASHQRLYLGYSTGDIRYLDVNAANPAEATLVTMAAPITWLTSTGNYLAAQTGGYSSYSSAAYVLDSTGATKGTGGQYYSAVANTWDPVTSRLYYVTNGSYTFYYDVIDQTTGTVTSSGDSIEYNATIVAPPARVSVNGSYILLGNGSFYAQANLNWVGSLGSSVTDARWFANGSLVTLVSNGNQTTLRHLGNSNLKVLEQKAYTGQALRVVGSDAAMAVLVNDNGAVKIYSYVPSNDTDGDGVANTADAFPLDPAASVDTDGDGYPDSWNAGKSQADSTTGLVLDAFPTENACWLASHGSGGVCNYGATMPNYIPDDVEQRGNVIYLLSTANNRVYRWSMATGAYLKPYIVGVNPGFGMLAPSSMAYSTGHQRLYLGYANGEIRYLDVTAATPVETALTTLSPTVSSLSDAGNFLLAQAGQNNYDSGYVLNSSGVVTAKGGYYYGYSRETAWDPVSSRVYYLRDGISPNNLQYDVIDQATGAVSSTLEAPYHGDYNFNGPIRVSTDAAQILVGSGDIYARNGLTRSAVLGKNFADAFWKDGILVDVDTTDMVEIRDANSHAVLQTYQYLGTPLRVLTGTSEAYLVHVVGGTTAFVRLPFYDQDGDGIPRWWEQLYANNGAGMSDTNAADATTDLDGDGINNLTEYQNHSSPLATDTDGDGLSDNQEILTWHTSPANPDTDGDGLNDRAEVVTYHSDPNVTDTDGDSYSDLDEVLYGGNPTDSSVLPQPLLNYSQTFEGTPNLNAWFNSPGNTGGAWAVDSTQAHAGSASFRSGTTGNSQTSAVKFHGFFRPGTLTFWARLDGGYCCNHLIVSLDGAQVQYLGSSTQWSSYTLQIPLGVHEIEWRYETYSTGGQPGDSAWIDDVVFTGQ